MYFTPTGRPDGGDADAPRKRPASPSRRELDPTLEKCRAGLKAAIELGASDFALAGAARRYVEAFEMRERR